MTGSYVSNSRRILPVFLPHSHRIPGALAKALSPCSVKEQNTRGRGKFKRKRRIQEEKKRGRAEHKRKGRIQEEEGNARE